tara:strand:- start:533 stop:949 length:417 start_codon:yes stop_codon:yes gene_type:complete
MSKIKDFKMKKLILFLLFTSFAFSAITFNKTMAYGNISGDAVEVRNGFGLDFDINDNMSLGYDTIYGMMVKADNLPAGITFRLGIKDSAGGTSALTGLGYDWWKGTGKINTTLGTSIDYLKSSDNEETSISINLRWGF